jgi:hypothetical protein
LQNEPQPGGLLGRYAHDPLPGDPNRRQPADEVVGVALPVGLEPLWVGVPGPAVELDDQPLLRVVRVEDPPVQRVVEDRLRQCVGADEGDAPWCAGIR